MPHPLAFHESPEFRRERRRAAFESRLVEHLLGRYGLTKEKPRLFREAYETTGTRYVTFGQFVMNFPSFPAYCATAVIPGLHKASLLAHLFNHFSSQRFVTAYETLRDEITPDTHVGAPFGLVFPFKGVTRGLVLHDGGIDLDDVPTGVLKKPCVRLIWSPPKARVKRLHTSYLTVEPFEQFLAINIREWRWRE